MTTGFDRQGFLVVSLSYNVTPSVLQHVDNEHKGYLNRKRNIQRSETTLCDKLVCINANVAVYDPEKHSSCAQ
jgi:hypothetical protein